MTKQIEEYDKQSHQNKAVLKLVRNLRSQKKYQTIKIKSLISLLLFCSVKYLLSFISGHTENT